MNVLICISSKFPNPQLYDCIDSLYKVQINKDPNYIYKIHVLDSNSSNFINYIKINKDFPDVKIHIIKNKNYEYGAWKYSLDKYPNFDIYFCIQDSQIIHTYIDLNAVNDKSAYTFHHNSGYNSHPEIKHLGIENLRESKLNYVSIIDSNFTLAQHNSFIINKNILEDMFKHLTKPPTDKSGSCFYERNFGIYFLDKNIITIDLTNYINKTHGKRE
jgi:hypothetical protein